jgi:GR25 family glycosyltransferase involved in LPS biosynthesis
MDGVLDQVYVINMDRSPERMEFMDEQCRRHGLRYVRVPATDGAKVSGEALERVATPWCRRMCTPAMVGCALSHMRVWKAMAKQGHSRCLVMEDDAALVPGFAEGLRRALDDVPEDFDVLLLGCFFMCNKQRRYAWTHRVAGMVMPYPPRQDTRTWGSVFVPERFGGTHCYVLSAKGCRTLMATIPRVNFHIDVAMNHPDIALYAVHPDLAFQRDMADSTIAEFAFPKSLVPWLSSIKDDKNITAAYYMDCPAAQIAGYRINVWTFIFLGVGLFKERFAPYVVGVLLAEFALGSDISMPLLAYASGWAVRGVLHGV